MYLGAANAGFQAGKVIGGLARGAQDDCCCCHHHQDDKPMFGKQPFKGGLKPMFPPKGGLRPMFPPKGGKPEFAPQGDVEKSKIMLNGEEHTHYDIDSDGDGKFDTWENYDKNGTLRLKFIDNNKDAQSDICENYDENGTLRSRSMDKDGDGKFETVLEEYDENGNYIEPKKPKRKFNPLATGPQLDTDWGQILQGNITRAYMGPKSIYEA